MKHKFLFKKIIKPGFIVLDIGSHVGMYAKWFSKLVKDKGRVYSFEPHPEHILKVKEVAYNSRYKNIFPQAIAIEDHSGEVYFYYGKSNKDSQASTICSNQVDSRFGSDFEQISVPSKTVDEFCMDNNIIPDFVKIDVEGAEDRVIKGMKEYSIKQNKVTILFEHGLGGGADSGVFQAF